MTGRAGRRGMDHIGFAVTVPGKFMDIRRIAKLITSLPSDVSSQIKINFSMALNLLLSHTPDQIEDLLKKSFATYLIVTARKKMGARNCLKDEQKQLWRDFLHHLNFLKDTGYVTEQGALTPDGKWASQLRVDEPIMIAQGLRLGIFPESDPALLAAVIALFVNERESDDRIEKMFKAKTLLTTFLKVKTSLEPFAEQVFAAGCHTLCLGQRSILGKGSIRGQDGGRRSCHADPQDCRQLKTCQNPCPSFS